VYTAAAVWNRTVYVGTYDGYVVAYDAATGDERWRYSAAGSIHGAPSILDGLIYFSTCGTCGQRGSRYAKPGPRTTFALDARTGKLVWTFPDGHYSPVVADSERLYLAGSTRVYGLEPVRKAAR
jgi:outer membrane protein assembly factor BamB